MTKFVERFGLRAFRRPLTDSERARYASLAGQVAREKGEFLAGAQIAIEAMLQSPNFLMRIGYGPGHEPESYENAANLAFFLWDTIPGERLLKTAAKGELKTAAQIEAAARWMLEDPRAQGAMDEFLSQWMRFDRAARTIRDRKFYPQFNSEMALAMTEETRRLFNHLVWGDQDFREFFSARYSFINSELAGIYELPEPAEPFGRVDFPADYPRAGVIGQGTFLLLTSKPSDTSPTERGLFVREHFLCQNVPPPPPGVNASLPPLSDEKPMTNRDRLEIHLTSEACSGCHNLVDPIGLGLEKFDAIGQYRAKYHVVIPPTRDEQQRKIKTEATEYDLDIDVTAEVVGIPNSSFSTPKELGDILAGDEGCQRCVVKQLFRYALGRSETLADREAIDRAYEAFRGSRYRFKELIISIATSDSFRAGRSRGL